jgi:hypothetical protein
VTDKTLPPLLYRWSGVTFVPLPRFQERIARHYKPGQVVQLEEVFDRSRASHNQFFAIVDTVWSNLPHGIAEHYPTPGMFRKWVLINCGWCVKRQFPASSKAEARRIAIFLKSKADLSDADDDFVVVDIKDRVVTEYKARSMKMARMQRAEFQKAKTDALDYMADLIGVDRDTMVDPKNRNAA